MKEKMSQEVFICDHIFLNNYLNRYANEMVVLVDMINAWFQNGERWWLGEVTFCTGSSCEQLLLFLTENLPGPRQFSRKQGIGSAELQK